MEGDDDSWVFPLLDEEDDKDKGNPDRCSTPLWLNTHLVFTANGEAVSRASKAKRWFFLLILMFRHTKSLSTTERFSIWYTAHQYLFIYYISILITLVLL